MGGGHDKHEEEGVAFFRKVAQRQRWGDKQCHPHTNWGDTFFDLFYVAGAYNLGNLLKSEPSAKGILYFCGCFWPLMILWLQKMHFDSRFYARDDLYHRIYEFTVLVVLATAVLHIRPVSVMSDTTNNVDMFTFSLAISIGTLLVIGRSVEFFVVGVDGEPAAKAHSKRDLPCAALAGCFYIAATIYSGVKYFSDDDTYEDSSNYESTSADDDHHRMLAGAAPTTAYPSEDTTNIPVILTLVGGVSFFFSMTISVVFFVLPNGQHKKITVPMNISFAIHRFGEWIMLMLGESVLSLLIVDRSGGLDYYKTFFSGIISITLLEYLHFRSQPSHADDHAMRKSVYAALLFNVFHQVYSAALVALGAGYKMLLYEYVYDAKDDGSDHRRLSSNLLLRLLAGSDESGSQFSAEERQQRTAHIFCGSLALVWFCLDGMVVIHKGLKDNLGRCRCEHSGGLKWASVLFTLVRVGLIVFMATLSQYITEPETLAFLGLVGIIAQIVLRLIGSSIFPDYDLADQEDEEGRIWPNTTKPMAIPADNQDSEAKDGLDDTKPQEQTGDNNTQES